MICPNESIKNNKIICNILGRGANQTGALRPRIIIKSMIDLADYFELHRTAKTVRLITPQDLNTDNLEVYRFTEKNVRSLISDEVKCGVYLIGTLTPRVEEIPVGSKITHDFRVCYFGRSDDSAYSLQRRICDHLAVGGKDDEDHTYSDNLYFIAWSLSSSQEAYEIECKFFDMFFSAPDIRRCGNGYNQQPLYSHDVKRGNPYPLPNVVYVDNQICPARPSVEIGDGSYDPLLKT